MSVLVLSSAYVLVCADYINTLVTNGISHRYHLDESIFIFGGIKSNFSYLFHFSNEIPVSKLNSPRWDAASHLGIFCLPMSHKKDARLIWVKLC